MSVAVSMTGISKAFGPIQALSDVDLQVDSQTIHALVGENGAGKTTLMRVLYGALKEDAGAIEIEGKRAHFNSSREAISAGVGMVSQHYGIIPELTCLQNLMLGHEGSALIHPVLAERRAAELASGMGFSFDWHRQAEVLGPAGAQKLEILKLLWRNAKIMILDEPTAMLSPADGEALFASLKQLTAGGATVILVTHRLPEVLQHCSEVTILRAGRKVADRRVPETDGSELAQLIVGGAIAPPPERASATGDVILRVDGLRARGRRGEDALKSVDFEVRAGEILGIAGVDGSGQRELFHTLLGLLRPYAGMAWVDGANLASLGPAERIEMGLRLIPEDRHVEGVIEEWPLEENAALGLQRLVPMAAGFAVDRPGRRAAADEIAKRFDTKHGGLQNRMASLSGGNQQRFVAGRALFLTPRLLLAFQPARGLDINGTTRVYEGIREACRQGAAALVVSFDLDELLAYSDRIVAMNRGELFHAPAGKSLDRETIGRLMVGVA